MTTTEADLSAADVTWDLRSLLDGAQHPSELVAKAKTQAEGLQHYRGRVANLDAGEMAELMTSLASVNELISRAGHFGMLSFSEDTLDPERGAMMQQVQEESTAIGTLLVFAELEFAAIDDDQAEALLADDRLAFCRHHLETTRLNRPHLLSEAEETVLIETSVTRGPAWVRLFSEQISAIELELDDGEGGTEMTSLEQGLSLLQHTDRATRQMASEAVTKGLNSGLRTRAFIFNTLLLDKSVDDRLRSFDTWISSRNLANEASDASVEALISAVVNRYDIPRRWYRLKASVLGVERLADYDRMAAVAASDQEIGWTEATAVVRDAYQSFSPELAQIVDRFVGEGWIHAPIQHGKQPGAFCAYSVPSHHPYVLLNWTSRHRDVLTLAHELGHGVHAYLSRSQGIFHHGTPLTLAETASVFAETVTNKRLLALLDDPHERFALLASTIDDSIATVFRQVAMNRFEHACHTSRRGEGELSVEGFGDHWLATQFEMMGDAVELTDNYRNWWSYIPHFMGTPGYVYAYAYGQLLALSVYARYEAVGPEFVPSYLELLSSGGSLSPEDLGSIVDCDLSDPGFWDGGLAIVENQLNAAEEAARAAGRLS
ncbi:MAG: M3 family oligoendopeptidase [Actinomycetia bacterium]|nr:M3 family oligoendopeptidase [Actinomycetes bacterium]MCP5034566.1 M3 family oligoendopeptidase [Actinomycetes bacterium]